MIKYRAHINKIIMTNVQTLSVAKMLSTNEMESILLKIKLEVMESKIDVTFKSDVEGFLSHQNIKNLAIRCHQRYSEDLHSLKLPGFFKVKWPLLVPLVLAGFMIFLWLMLDIFKPFETWNLFMALKGLFIALVFMAVMKLNSHYASFIKLKFSKESEVLRSKIFGLIYENMNSLYINRSSHAS